MTDGVSVLIKMTWQDIVDEKRRIQANAVEQFGASDGNTEFEKVDLNGNGDLSSLVEESVVLSQLASSELSCKSLIARRIRQ